MATAFGKGSPGPLVNSKIASRRLVRNSASVMAFITIFASPSMAAYGRLMSSSVSSACLLPPFEKRLPVSTAITFFQTQPTTNLKCVDKNRKCDLILRPYARQSSYLKSRNLAVRPSSCHRQFDALTRSDIIPHNRSYRTYLEGTRSVAEQSSGPISEVPKANIQPRKPRKKGTKKSGLQRVDKVLADRGVGTRSQTFELAKMGRITTASYPDAPHEERKRIRGPSEKISPDAALFLDGKALPGPTPLLLAYHKPKFMLSVMEDDKKYEDQQRRHLGQVLEARYLRSGMHPVGRLDYDTTGLILFSSDGKLTQKLLHPRRGIEKEYVATVKGTVDEDVLREKLVEGVQTTEGIHYATLVDVSSSEGPSESESESDQEDENPLTVCSHEQEDVDTSKDSYGGPYSDVRLIVNEGKYRMVRRMLHNCGHSVVELRRERHGMVRLGDLKVGEFRMVTNDELQWAESLLK